MARRDAQRTRAAIIAAARRLFGRAGYAATTVRAIAAEAGCSPALINRYFGGKQALYRLVLTEPVSGRGFAAGELDAAHRARQLLLWHFAVADGMDERMRRERIGLLTRSIDPGESGAAARELASDYIGEFGLNVTGPDAELRQALLMSAQIGLMLMQEMMQLPELANAPDEKVLWYLGPALHQLFEPHRPFPTKPG